MKKNTKTYVLLGVVLLIWGIVGYRVYSSMSPDAIIGTSFGKTTFTPKTHKEKDTFNIVADYRDPFLGTMSRKNVKKRVSAPKKNPLPLIDIRYTGIITDTETKEHIFFVTIAGNQNLMRIKDKIQEVSLLSGTRKSIRVKHNGKIRTIQLQE